MKVLRIIGLIFTKLALSIGVMCLLLSYILGGFITNGFTTALVMEPSTVEILESSGIDSEKFSDIISSKEGKELIDKYISPFLNENIDVSNIDIGYDLMNFIRNNESKIEEMIGEEVNLDELENYLVSEEIEKVNETYKEAVKSVHKDVPKEVKSVISAVKYFFSDEFRKIMLAVSVVGLLLTALFQWSYYIWIRTLGNTLTWCGLIGCSICGLSNLTLLETISFFSSLSQNGFASSIYIPLIVFLFGIILLIIYFFIKKMIKKRGVNNVISEGVN